MVKQKVITIDSRIINRKKFGLTNFFQTINAKLNQLSTFQFSVLLIGVILITYFGYGGIWGLGQGKVSLNPFSKLGVGVNCKDKENELDANCWSLLPKLQETGGYTNALLIGVDTRANDPGLMNTDTIMIASYDHETGKTILISFPRDLYLTYTYNGRQLSSKINSIFNAGGGEKGNGVQLLEHVIEQILNIKIHYSAIVNFDAVTEAVDSIGGINITLKKDFLDLYPYSELRTDYQRACNFATDFPEYCVFKFSKGLNLMNAQDVLIYSRARQYSSDFDRARRQQEVLDAIKDQLLGDGTNLVEKLANGWKIYQSVSSKGYVKSNLTYQDVLGGIREIQKADKDPISVVLDVNFGGEYKYFFETQMPEGLDPLASGGIYVIKPKDMTFKGIRTEIDRIRAFGDLYRDKASVLVVNRTGKEAGEGSEIKKLQMQNPYFEFLFFTSDAISTSLGTNIIVFNPTKTVSAEYLRNFFSNSEIIYANETNGLVKTTKYLEDIRVEVN